MRQAVQYKSRIGNLQVVRARLHIPTAMQVQSSASRWCADRGEAKLAAHIVLMRLKIVTAGEAVLRQPARPLTLAEVRSPEIQQLIQHMRETMQDAPGVGLAAPQVGMPLQLAVIEDKQEYLAGLSAEQIAERERQPVPFHVIINPVLQLRSAPDLEFFEGCLSVPGFVAIVPRVRSVRVECLDETGAPRVIKASGWYARILQHEIDHLHGTLYLDRMLSRTYCSVENHTRLWKNRTIAEAKAMLAGS
jgi:peptide deformylase